MQLVIRAFLVVVVTLFLLPEPGIASIIFQAGKKAKYVPPGEEEMSGDAAELCQIGQKAEKDGDNKRAIRAYKSLVKRHPKDALAPTALYRAAQLQEQTRQYTPAANSYLQLVERYPSSAHFDEAIEGQFRAGEIYLNGKKLKVLGIPVASALDRAVTIFADVVRTAPYGKYTARAQFDIGLAREKQGANDAAIQAYQAVVDKFPNDPVAANAQYQIGYIWFTAARQGTKDLAASDNARTAFQDFLFRYPNSEKVAQTHANLQLLERKQTSSAFSIAKFYDKQKYYRAAVIYYNEVIRQQPGSTESDRAQKRIEQLRKKLGEAALQPAFAASEAAAAKKKTSGLETAKGGRDPRGSSTEATPLPPPETDVSLPPPASLMPDTTTAPASAPAPAAGPSSEAPGAPEASASPDATASPAP